MGSSHNLEISPIASTADQTIIVSSEILESLKRNQKNHNDFEYLAPANYFRCNRFDLVCEGFTKLRKNLTDELQS